MMIMNLANDSCRTYVVSVLAQKDTEGNATETLTFGVGPNRYKVLKTKTTHNNGHWILGGRRDSRRLACRTR